MSEETWPEVRVYLSLASDNELLSEVSSLVGTPDQIHAKGQLIHSANPDRTYEQNFYLYGQLDRIRCLDVPSLVKEVVAKIEGKGSALVAAGFQVELAIVVNFDGAQAPILSFGPEILATLHQAKGHLDIDTYP